jgi:prepilin-type processing-associated H-X9-DG protein
MPRHTRDNSNSNHRALAARRAFSLIELIVVLGITTVLIGLLMPGLRAARESARRLICASGERQIGVGFALYAKDYMERMPESWFLGRGELTEMMAISTGEKPPEQDGDQPDRSEFEGLGRLLPLAGGYVDNKSCFYCPSHSGHNTMEHYDGMFHGTDPTKVYCNYHYTGHQRRVLQDDGTFSLERRLYGNGLRQVLLTDGLRIRKDFSHRTGMNVLFADGSIQWHADTANEIFDRLPAGADDDGVVDPDHVDWVWRIKLHVSD